LSPDLLVALAKDAPATSWAVAATGTRQRRLSAEACNPSRTEADEPNAVQLAREWVATQSPSIEGENGSARCFAIACALVRDWALTREAARSLLVEYSARCLPPWDEREIDHKLDGAEKAAAAEPRRVGWRLRAAEKENGGGRKRQTDADRMVSILTERTTLWHTADHTAYASIHHQDHTENYPVSSKMFSTWLSGVYFQLHGTIAKKPVLADAIHTATGLAIHQGEQHAVSVRVAGAEDRIYLDLGNKQWEAVEIDAEGWRIVTEMPVKFRRPSGQLPLPQPEQGASIEALREFVPVASEKDFVLLVAFLVSALRPDGPYPSLVLTGRQGSGKSTLSRVIRSSSIQTTWRCGKCPAPNKTLPSRPATMP
jgi:hypothetical protein